MPGDPRDPSLTERRIALLERFLSKLREYEGLETADHYADWAKIRARQQEVKSEVNRLLVAARQAVHGTGLSTSARAAPPPMVGGLVIDFDLFHNVFTEIYGSIHVHDTIDITEKALGVYEMMRDQPDLIRIGGPETLDILDAIERALRPAFKHGAPEKEIEVQDAIEVILRSIGVKFHREKERAPVGNVAYTPDFTFPGLDLALEVKHARPTNNEKEITRQISDDITGYGTRWRHAIFVIYDNGVITDPMRFADAILELGARALVVKH